MKIWEIDKTEDKEYCDSNGRIWQYNIRGNFRNENDDITDIYVWSEIYNMEFELYQPIDWLVITTDTPLYVRDYTSEEWEKRHFASFHDDKIYVYPGGMTSWTSHPQYAVSYKYAKLS